MSSRCVALAFCILAPVVQAGTNTTAVPARSQVMTWSRSASPLPNTANSDPSLLNARIPSPNGRYEIACVSSAHEQRVSSSVSEMTETPSCEFVGGGRHVPIDLQVGPEALWAPDSDAVAITNSRGGALGTYQVLIYRPEENGATNVTSEVQRDLAKRFPACAGSEAGCSASQRKRMRRDTSWVNVAAIRWMHESHTLLVMAWVPDSSEFGVNLGRHQGYVIDARTGRILNRYSEAEFTRKFRKYCGDWGL